MKTSYGETLLLLNRGRLKQWKFVVTALVSFAAGSLLTARVTHLEQVRAESHRVFELMIYHAAPGKAQALESVFRGVSKLQAKHNLDVVGYWMPDDNPAWKDTFIYLVAHPSLDEAKKNWDALHADPAFPPYRDAAEPLIKQTKGEYQVDEVYMRPTDYSVMK